MAFNIMQDVRDQQPKVPLQWNQPEAIDLLELVGAIRERFALVVKAVLVCLLIAAGYLAYTAPTYESTAMLRVKQDKGIGSSMLESVPGMSNQASKQLIETYSEILKSESVVGPLIPEFTKPNDEGVYPEYSNELVTKNITTKLICSNQEE